MTDEKCEQEQRWRELLEQLGLDVVRTRFSARMPVWEPERYGPLPPDAFIEAWIAEKTAAFQWRETWRFWVPVGIALVALVPNVPTYYQWLLDAWTLLKKFCCG
jgi:hypothetical protein